MGYYCTARDVVRKVRGRRLLDDPILQRHLLDALEDVLGLTDLPPAASTKMRSPKVNQSPSGTTEALDKPGLLYGDTWI